MARASSTRTPTRSRTASPPPTSGSRRPDTRSSSASSCCLTKRCAPLQIPTICSWRSSRRPTTSPPTSPAGTAPRSNEPDQPPTPQAGARKDRPDDGRTVATTDTAAEVDSILADAVETAGLDDFEDTWFLGPLAAYAADLVQSNLTAFGRKFLRSRAVHEVVRRLRVLETLRRHPEIAAVPVPPIVYITGLERSGTTLLHNLLALHRDARVLRRWELLEPVPPPETATYVTDSRIARVQGQADL